MKIVEIDVDCVLLDVYTPVENYLRERGINFKFADSVRTFGMKETGQLRSTLLHLLTDADMRRQAEWYNGAKSFVRFLSEYCKYHNYALVLNTHERNYAAAQVKLQKLEELQMETGACFESNVQCGGRKEMLHSFICVDDCLDNICRSPAEHPLLFNMCHNTELYNGYRKGIVRVNGYDGVITAMQAIDAQNDKIVTRVGVVV